MTVNRVHFFDGEKFGRLEAVEYLKGSKYRCRCECGNETTVRSSDLRRGKVKSCGCLKKEQQLDLRGKKFDRLTVLKRTGKINNRYKFLCVCACGKHKEVFGRDLTSGKAKSCGSHITEYVREANTTHGDSNSSLYKRYLSMNKRCYNSGNVSYESYGGRGIRICDEWLGSDGYESFKQWSVANGYDKSLSIDRIDVDGDYSPDNCRWTDRYTQANNKRSTVFITVKGESNTLSGWCRVYGLKYSSVHKRIQKYGYSAEDAVTKNLDRVKK